MAVQPAPHPAIDFNVDVFDTAHALSKLLMVSDILLEGTELLAVGHTRLVEKAFGASLQEQALYLPGVLSRKKQVVPPIASAV